MLSTCAEATDEQGRDETNDSTAETGKYVAKACERGAERQHRRGTETFSQKTRRNLEASKRARKDRSHQPEGRKTETEFALPDRQHHVDEVGVPVMQRMRTAGNAESTSLCNLRRSRIRRRRAIRGRAHACQLSRKNTVRWQSGNASHRRPRRRNLCLPVAFSRRRVRPPRLRRQCSRHSRWSRT